MRHLERLNASRKTGFVSTVSARALNVAIRNSLSGLLHHQGNSATVAKVRLLDLNPPETGDGTCARAPSPPSLNNSTEYLPSVSDTISASQSEGRAPVRRAPEAKLVISVCSIGSVESQSRG